MIVKNFEKIDENHLDPLTPTKNGIGLCFFNPETETLVEFSADSTIPVLPYEDSIKRYYIVRDQSLSNINTISITMTSTNPNFIIKNIKGIIDPESTDFDSVPVNNTNVIFLSEYTSGVIPIDVYVKSNTYSLTKVPLVIEMEIS